MSSLIKYLILLTLLCFTSVVADTTQPNSIKPPTLTVPQKSYTRKLSYYGKDPQDIRIVPKPEIEVIVLPRGQRRGVLREVHISMLVKALATRGVKFRLIDPPKGMKEQKV